MVEDNQAVVESDLAIGQFEIIGRTPRKFWFDEILQIITPVTKAAAQREWQIHFFEQLIARHQHVEDVPGIAELRMAESARS